MFLAGIFLPSNVVPKCGCPRFLGAIQFFKWKSISTDAIPALLQLACGRGFAMESEQEKKMMWRMRGLWIAMASEQNVDLPERWENFL
jgi:hypothetical protein